MKNIFLKNERLMVTKAIKNAITPPMKGARNMMATIFNFSPESITQNPA